MITSVPALAVSATTPHFGKRVHVIKIKKPLAYNEQYEYHQWRVNEREAALETC
jgi:hypothetical protein